MSLKIRWSLSLSWIAIVRCLLGFWVSGLNNFFVGAYLIRFAVGFDSPYFAICHLPLSFVICYVSFAICGLPFWDSMSLSRIACRSYLRVTVVSPARVCEA